MAKADAEEREREREERFGTGGASYDKNAKNAPETGRDNSR